MQDDPIDPIDLEELDLGTIIPEIQSADPGQSSPNPSPQPVSQSVPVSEPEQPLVESNNPPPPPSPPSQPILSSSGQTNPSETNQSHGSEHKVCETEADAKGVLQRGKTAIPHLDALLLSTAVETDENANTEAKIAAVAGSFQSKISSLKSKLESYAVIGLRQEPPFDLIERLCDPQLRLAAPRPNFNLSSGDDLNASLRQSSLSVVARSLNVELILSDDLQKTEIRQKLRELKIPKDGASDDELNQAIDALCQTQEMAAQLQLTGADELSNGEEFFKKRLKQLDEDHQKRIKNLKQYGYYENPNQLSLSAGDDRDFEKRFKGKAASINGGMVYQLNDSEGHPYFVFDPKVGPAELKGIAQKIEGDVVEWRNLPEDKKVDAELATLALGKKARFVDGDGAPQLSFLSRCKPKDPEDWNGWWENIGKLDVIKGEVSWYKLEMTFRNDYRDRFAKMLDSPELLLRCWQSLSKNDANARDLFSRLTEDQRQSLQKEIQSQLNRAQVEKEQHQEDGSYAKLKAEVKHTQLSLAQKKLQEIAPELFKLAPGAKPAPVPDDPIPAPSPQPN